MQPPKLIESTIVFDSFFKIRRDRLRNHNSVKEFDYYSLVTLSDAVIILPQNKDGLFVLNEEYRQPPQTFILSCPGGYLNDNETPADGAVRELMEETGFTAKKFVLLGSAFPYPGISGQKLYFVAALDAEKTSEPKLEPGEIINTKLMTMEEIQAYIRNGSPLDGILCTALFFFNLEISK